MIVDPPPKKNPLTFKLISPNSGYRKFSTSRVTFIKSIFVDFEKKKPLRFKAKMGVPRNCFFQKCRAPFSSNFFTGSGSLFFFPSVFGFKRKLYIYIFFIFWIKIKRERNSTCSKGTWHRHVTRHLSTC